MWWAAQDAISVQDVASRIVDVAREIARQVFPLRGFGAWSALAAVALAIPVATEATRLRTPARRFFLALFAGAAVHVLACVLLLGRLGSVRWYFVPEYVVACLFLGAALGRARPRLVAGAVAILLCLQMLQSHQRITEPRPGLHRARYELAQEIGSALPPDALLGAWNAGEIGYFTPQTVVNLDGLANDAHYFNFLRDGGDVRDYLEEQGIEYIVDYNRRDSSMPLDDTWDSDNSFRGLWPLAELDIVLQRNGLRRGELMVFRVNARD